MLLELTDKYCFWYFPAIAVSILILCSILALCCPCVKRLTSILIYRFQRRVFDNVVTIVFYPLLFLSIVLIIFELIFFFAEHGYLDFSKCEREVAYPFILSVFSVLIAIMLALKLNVKKIETGEEFISALKNVIIGLNKKSKKDSAGLDGSKPKIHIYTPALCIGIGIMINSMNKKVGNDPDTQDYNKYKSQMRSMIEAYDRVTYVFHTKKINYELLKKQIKGGNSASWYYDDKKGMLYYIAKNYFDNIIVGQKESIRNDIMEIVNKVGKDNIIEDYKFDDECAGYYTDNEVLFGKITSLNRKKGISEFCGEIVTSHDFMDFIRQNQSNLPS